MKFITSLLLNLCFLVSVFAQVGVGTDTPGRILEVAGTGDERIRIRSLDLGSSTAGLEFVTGELGDPNIDWQIVNDEGIFKINSGNYKDYGSSFERFRINEDGNVGIGTTAALAKLHIDNGELVNLLQDGLLLLGVKTGANLAIDDNKIQARSNGSAVDMYLQNTGGDTYFNTFGGNVYAGTFGGRIGVGTMSPTNRLHVNGNDWQLYLNNNGNGGPTDWYIGASASGWAAGDDQLLFSRTSNSNDALMRIRNTSDNNGTIAPFSIRSGDGQELLIDGNEIDTKSGPLYVNYNSGEDTYLNPTGGQVVVGATNPLAGLTIYSPTQSLNMLRVARGIKEWDIYPQKPCTCSWSDLRFAYNGDHTASISGWTGEWFTYSDRAMKDNIQAIGSVMERVMKTNTYTYSFKGDDDHNKYYGVMAQEVLNTFPQAVKSTDDHVGVAYGELAVIAIKAIQEQQELITHLESLIAELESQ